MHDRDVIADVLWEARANRTAISGGELWGFFPNTMTIFDLAERVQAELVRASTVTTEAELNALPAKTVIHDRDGEVFVYEDELERGWFYPGDDDPLPSRMIDLPATILFRPV